MLRFRLSLSTFLFVHIALLISAPAAFGQPVCTTTIPTGSYFAVTWDEPGSPYCVTGDIQVGALTVDPGVKVYVDGSFAIDVLSDIIAIGTAQKRILFSAFDPENSKWRGFKFNNTTDTSNFTYTDIEYSDESAITLINADAPVLNFCRLKNNSRTGLGGAISGTGITSDLVITGSGFFNNTSTSDGGAISADFATGFRLDIENSFFGSNTANPNLEFGNFMGGAIYLPNDDATISSSHFTQNQANAHCTGGSFDCNVLARGGAIWVGSGSDVVIQSTNFINNRTYALNSGVCFFGGITQSRGGGIYVDSGTAFIANTLFSCNENIAVNCELQPSGAGLYVNTGTVTVENTTVARNGASTGVQEAAGTLDITNSIVFFNNDEGEQIGGSPSVTFSDIQTDGPDPYPGLGNIRPNPIFQGTGCSKVDLYPAFISATVDGGDDSDMSFDDACIPPGQDTVINDMGAFGGPGNCIPLPEPDPLLVLVSGIALLAAFSRQRSSRSTA